MIKSMDKTFPNIKALIEAIHRKGSKAIDISPGKYKSRRS
jgi:hypothetical protein